MSFHGKTVVVIGMGKSGTAAVRLLLNGGATVRGFDESPQASAPSSDPRFTLDLGPLRPDFFRGADAVVVSPGVPFAKAELSAAREAGVPVYGEIELAWRTLPKGAGPILGVTGTNGKSTTTALLGELMRQQGLRTFVGGNLGVPFTLAYEDPATAPYEMHVIELSSFQLEGIIDAKLDGAAILNLTPDHLDRYPSLEAYGAAKARVFMNQPPGGFAVVNLDDPRVRGLFLLAKVPVYGFTRDGRFLQTAEACADYYIERTPAHGVPPNDWDEPNPALPYESSAAAIAASGMLNLSKLTGDKARARRYRDYALRILDTLTTPEFLAEETPGWEGILKHGMYHQRKGLGVDESVMWGEYFFLEALNKVKDDE